MHRNISQRDIYLWLAKNITTTDKEEAAKDSAVQLAASLLHLHVISVVEELFAFREMFTKAGLMEK